MLITLFFIVDREPQKRATSVAQNLNAYCGEYK